MRLGTQIERHIMAAAEQGQSRKVTRNTGSSAKDTPKDTAASADEAKSLRADNTEGKRTGASTGMGAQTPGDDFTPLGVGVESESAKKKVSGAKTKGGGGRKRVTNEEAEAMITKWREDRADKKRERIANRAPKASIIRNVLAVGFIVGSVATFLAAISTAGTYEDQAAANNEQISKLQGEINDVDKRVQSIPEPEVMSAAMNDANIQAHKLVDLMNEIAAYPVPKDPIRESEDVEKYQALFDDLKTYYTASALSGGSFNPASVWFVPHMSSPDPEIAGTVPMPTSMWSWEVVPTHAIAPDGNVRVLFEQRLRAGENEGALLAWCEGKYDPQVRKFHSMALGVTSLGREHLGVTDSVGDAKSHEQQARNEVLDQALKDAQALEGAQPAQASEDAADKDAPAAGEGVRDAKDAQPEQQQQQPRNQGEGTTKPTPSADTKPENYLQDDRRVSEQVPAPATLR